MLPILFDIGGYPVYGYPMAVATGFALATYLFYRRTEGLLTPSQAGNMAGLCVFGVLFGSRALHLWLHDNAWSVAAMLDARTGLVFYGGLVSVPLTWGYLRVCRQPVLPVYDHAAVVLPLAHAFGRVGCLLAGCCFGRLTDMPWGVIYPTTPYLPWGPVHPVQLYEAAGLGLISAGLAVWHPRKAFDGQIVLLYAGLYSLLRFLTEFFRGDPGRDGFSGLATISQEISVVVGGLAAMMLVITARRVRT